MQSLWTGSKEGDAVQMPLSKAASYALPTEDTPATFRLTGKTIRHSDEKDTHMTSKISALKSLRKSFLVAPLVGAAAIAIVTGNSATPHVQDHGQVKLAAAWDWNCPYTQMGSGANCTEIHAGDPVPKAGPPDNAPYLWPCAGAPWLRGTGQCY